jgi:Golgi nucleoside diphosphatase
MVTIVLFVLTSGFWAAGIVAKTSSSVCASQQCVAIIDAGSTGSRIHLFAYDTHKRHELMNIHEVYANKIQPGLTSIDLDQSKINTYLTDTFLFMILFLAEYSVNTLT